MGFYYIKQDRRKIMHFNLASSPEKLLRFMVAVYDQPDSGTLTKTSLGALLIKVFENNGTYRFFLDIYMTFYPTVERNECIYPFIL